ncbi:MAG: DUF1598 domain-containing protein [Planctomycetota bacterium]
MRVSLTGLCGLMRGISLILVMSFASSSLLVAQDSDSTAGSSAVGGLLGNQNGSDGGFGGGAAMADFDTLMNLIQQTIEPDSWLQNGGTNTILPYPSGVYVDPKGHMKRVRVSEQLQDELFRQNTELPHPWRNSSNLRTVSLKQLDHALQKAIYSGVPPTAELAKLAGLTKIKFVKIDVANEDILIAGPAGDSVAGFELQDLAVVAALVNSDTAPLGCSIEPSNQGLLDAQAYLQETGVIRKLARSPQQVVEQMKSKIGAHEVKVFGMNSNTGTAVALVDADEHMKKVGFGTVNTKTRIDSYFDHLSKLGDKVPNQSLIRWWFAFADKPVRISVSGDIFQLPEECVAVMSEQQWVSQQGRAPTGQNDPAADAFAQGMTENLDDLRKTHASYARLSAVFEISLALQLACERTGQPSLRAWLPNLCSLGRMAPPENPTPKTVEGLTTWHKLKNGTVLAVVSGGVKVDALNLAASDNWQESKFIASSVMPEAPAQPTVAHGRWWWDPR